MAKSCPGCKALKKDLAQQCKQTKEFGDELQYFMKKKANVRYELKLSKFKDEVVKLKKEIERLKKRCKTKLR